MRNFRNTFLAKISQIKINKKSFALTVVIIALITALVASLVYLGVKESKKFFSDKEVSSNASSNQAVVYKKSDGIFLTAKEKTVKLNVTDDSVVKITDDGRYLIYTVPSAKISKKYDLYICNLEKSSKVKKGPILTDYGIEPSFKYNDGILYYSKADTKTEAIMTYRYDIRRKKAEEIDFGVEDLYISKSTDTVYYTKKFSDSKALYEYTHKNGYKELAKPVKSVHFYDNTKESELLYEIGSAKEITSEIYKCVPGENSVKIATDVSKVFYDDYKIGNNLYYLVEKKVPTSWQGIIDDETAETDKKMTRPNKDDYRFIFGVSFQYTIDMEKYNAKLLRDEVRAYLNKETKKELSTASYDLYVHADDVSTQIADSVASDTIYAMAASGLPRVIYSGTKINPCGKSVSDFTDNIEKRKFSLIKPEIDEALKGCIVETGLTYADSKGLNIKLKDIDAKNTEFIFSKAENEFFTKVTLEDKKMFTVYRNLIVNKNLSDPEKIAANVKQAKYVDGILWYLKHDTDLKSGDLHKYEDGVTERIDTQVNSFTIHGNREVYLYKNLNKNDGEDIVSLYFCDGKKSKLVSQSVDPEQLMFKGSGAMFIRKSGTNGGELCSYIKGKLHVVDKNVYSLVDY